MTQKIDDEDLLAHMRPVRVADRDLRELNLQLQFIEACASISCPREVQSILPTLSLTRAGFDSLQQSLVHQLVGANLDRLKIDLGNRAQVAVDILVRNLFERTADVGFLATDRVLRDFAAAPPATRDLMRAAVRSRLADYRAKYTVYDDIILLTPSGEVIARLDEVRPASGPGMHSSDAVVGAALEAAGYVEAFGASDLAADDRPALRYAHRIESGAGTLLGVLVLRFRFEDEMTAVFRDLSAGHDVGAVCLIDGDGRAIATSEASYVRLGAIVPVGPAGELQVREFAGQEVLAMTCATAGYQGYSGLGWRGFAIVPLAVAFRSQGAAMDQAAPRNEPRVGRSDALARIENEAAKINRNLRRVVWNGRVMASAGGRTTDAAARLKAVLAQVTTIGARTRARVSAAVTELFDTARANTLREARSCARLAADIMDRNLYERANDCRWWALSPDIGTALQAAAGGAERADAELTAILEHLNSLYTVYRRVVVFDAQGTIRASSRDLPEPGAAGQEASLPVAGQAIDPELLRQVASLSDQQHYAASAFAATPLYDGRSTYVYLAAIRDGHRLVGGVAIVFAGETEFRAMLDAVVAAHPGAKAAFVDETGRVISSNDAEFPAGSIFPLTAGDATQVHEGWLYACGVVTAAGYREFKTADGYVNGVRAVVGLPLGPLLQQETFPAEDTPGEAGSAPCRQPMEFAVFQIGEARLALAVEDVIEAVAPQGLVRMHAGTGRALGLLEVHGESGSRVVWVLDGRRATAQGAVEDPASGVVILIRACVNGLNTTIGLWVDELLWVAEYEADAVHSGSAIASCHSSLLHGLVRTATATDALLPVISRDQLAAWVAADEHAAAESSRGSDTGQLSSGAVAAV